MKRETGIAAGGAAAAGVAGGLIGLGGAEFRLPLLLGPLRVPLREAVPLNLTVSLCVVLAALPLRLLQAPAVPEMRYVAGAVAIALGAVLAASRGAKLFTILHSLNLAMLIRGLLFVLGTIMLAEAVFPLSPLGLLGTNTAVQLVAGVLAGMAIGLVSSLLGVAGGELIIPTLVVGFGVPVKSAGTLSILISVPAMTVGLMKYRQLGALLSPSMREYFRPLAMGSVVGALAGAAMVGLVPAAGLKLLLGGLLIWSAFKAVPMHRTNQPGSGQFKRYRKGKHMKISARNMLKGKVKSVTHGPVSSEVVITLANGVDVTSVITESAAKELELKTGSAVYAVIKTSSVIVAMD